MTRLRTGLHKHGKEGLLCLLESCTGDEYDKVNLGAARGVGAWCLWQDGAFPAGELLWRRALQGAVWVGGKPCRRMLAQAPAACHTLLLLLLCSPAAPPHPPPLSNTAQVLLALGGRRRIASKLYGRLGLSWHYTRRLADVEATHSMMGRESLAYQNPELKYAALPGRWACCGRMPGMLLLVWLWPGPGVLCAAVPLQGAGRSCGKARATLLLMCLQGVAQVCLETIDAKPSACK